ncbi:hypothetical protein J5N97_017773 [Dioscorea zingiberensis]|uniref:Uncharacterized protein n=1 Tax=Dioscorea zingiberensis TaxID=325984 RepID=A0A9D5CLR3_9LILI|nr:hypothetical protein J5N97_017773 [Dioscorea zingiberensis]
MEPKRCSSVSPISSPPPNHRSPPLSSRLPPHPLPSAPSPSSFSSSPHLPHRISTPHSPRSSARRWICTPRGLGMRKHYIIRVADDIISGDGLSPFSLLITKVSSFTAIAVPPPRCRPSTASDCAAGLHCFSCQLGFSGSRCIRSSVTDPFKLLEEQNRERLPQIGIGKPFDSIESYGMALSN